MDCWVVWARLTSPNIGFIKDFLYGEIVDCWKAKDPVRERRVNDMPTESIFHLLVLVKKKTADNFLLGQQLFCDSQAMQPS